MPQAETKGPAQASPPSRWLVPAAFFLATFSFWVIRIADHGWITSFVPWLAEVIPKNAGFSPDLQVEHMQMTTAAFGRLARGELPLWNPYQLCGVPLLAIPYVGTFYPLNAVYMLSVPVGTEILFLAHTMIALLSVWFLCLRLGCSPLASATAAITFAWSGFVMLRVNQPSLHSAISYVPVVLLMIERTLSGKPWGVFGVAAGVAGIMLNGAAEILVHTLYLGALYTAGRAIGAAREVGTISAAQRSALVLVGVVSGVALSAPQLLPTMELAASRLSDPLTYGQVAGIGYIRPFQFAGGALTSKGIHNVGILAAVLLPLAIGFRKNQFAWVVFVVTAFLSMQLVFGLEIFRLYYETPLGDLFRRPMKFLDIYAVAQAMVVGIAVTNLQQLARLDRFRILRSPRWLASVSLGGYAMYWLSDHSLWSPYLLATVGLLTALPLAAERLRPVLVWGLCLIQVVSLYPSTPIKSKRLNQSPDPYTRATGMMDSMRPRLGHQRIYLSPKFMFDVALTAKAPMLYEVHATVGHDRLTPGRYATFFDSVVGDHLRKRRTADVFRGPYPLDDQSNYRLMDLVGTRYYVLRKNEPAAQYMASNRDDFHPFGRHRPGRIFERRSALPRAWLVHHARIAENADSAFAALIDPRFRPREEVILETDSALESTEPTAPGESASVRIVDDLPETVTLEAQTNRAGYLVLSDFHFPGWRATVNDQPAHIYQANFLMRAVAIEPGKSRITFSYQSAKVNSGLLISSTTALALIAGSFIARRRATGR